MTRSEPEWWDRIGWATRIVPRPPIDPRHIKAVRPRTSPALEKIAKRITALTQEARDIAGVDGRYFLSDGWCPSTVSLAIWETVLREIDGKGEGFTDEHRANIVRDAHKIGPSPYAEDDDG